MKDWKARPVPIDVPTAWDRVDRYIRSIPDFKPILTLPDGSAIIIDGETKIPHGERGRIPQSAILQIVGATVDSNPAVLSIDERFIYCDSNTATRVHVLVIL